MFMSFSETHGSERREKPVNSLQTFLNINNGSLSETQEMKATSHRAVRLISCCTMLKSSDEHPADQMLPTLPPVHVPMVHPRRAKCSFHVWTVLGGMIRECSAAVVMPVS